MDFLNNPGDTQVQSSGYSQMVVPFKMREVDWHVPKNWYKHTAFSPAVTVDFSKQLVLHSNWTSPLR